MIFNIVNRYLTQGEVFNIGLMRSEKILSAHQGKWRWCRFETPRNKNARQNLTGAWGKEILFKHQHNRGLVNNR